MTNGRNTVTQKGLWETGGESGDDEAGRKGDWDEFVG